MSVSNDLAFKVTCTKDECLEILWQLKETQYYSSASINNTFVMLAHKEAMAKHLNAIDFENPITFDVSGPYGRFELFDGLSKSLTNICQVFPHLEFEGTLHSLSEVDSSRRIIEFSYKKKTIKYMDSDYFENPIDDLYLKYMSKKLSYKKFTSLFKLDRESYEDYMYEEFVLEYIADGSFLEMDYDEWMDALEESELDEEKFEAVLEKLEELDIMTMDDYSFEVDFEPKRKDWVKKTVKI